MADEIRRSRLPAFPLLDPAYAPEIRGPQRERLILALYRVREWLHDEGFTSSEIDGRMRAYPMPAVEVPEDADLPFNQRRRVCACGRVIRGASFWRHAPKCPIAQRRDP